MKTHGKTFTISHSVQCIFKISKASLIAIPAMVLAACGGNTASTNLQGTFIDAPVQGLGYQTSSGLSVLLPIQS